VTIRAWSSACWEVLHCAARNSSEETSTIRKLRTWPALQVGKPAEEDLKSWGHHSSPSTVPDDIMAQADPSIVSFVFSCQVSKSGRCLACHMPDHQRMGDYSPAWCLQQLLLQCRWPARRSIQSRPRLWPSGSRLLSRVRAAQAASRAQGRRGCQPQPLPARCPPLAVHCMQTLQSTRDFAHMCRTPGSNLHVVEQSVRLLLQGPVRSVQSPAASTTPAQRQSAPGTALRRSCLGPGTTPGSARMPRMSAPVSAVKVTDISIRMRIEFGPCPSTDSVLPKMPCR
jgi:hypothetical protein